MKHHHGRYAIFRVIASATLMFAFLMTLYFYFRSPEAVRSKGGSLLPPRVAGPESPFRGDSRSDSEENPLSKVAEENIKSLVDPVAGEVGRSAAPAGDEIREIRAKAEEKIRAGEYETALRLLRGVADKAPGLLSDIGFLHLLLENDDMAIRYLEDAMHHNHNGNDFLAQKGLAVAYYRKGNIEKSLFHAERGLSLRGDPELQTLYDRIRKEQSVHRGFVDESTLHFKIVFDGHEHGGVSRKILGILEDAYRQVGHDLNHYPDELVTVVLYTNRDFHDITQAPEWAGGFYDGRIKVPVKGIEGKEEEVRRVLFHEYVHAMVHSIVGGNVRSLPLWINEGLAEYYSARHGRKIGQVVPLTSLDRSFAWLNERADIAYLESYSAVAYLMDTHRAYRMKDFLFSYAKGHDINKAFAEAFSITYNEFIATWGKN
ncbi:MAG: hypothetical protein K8I29_13875 [Alphaproteobacteria bacterium]|uniref:Peptidase MA-like domain-containing protein n=1 Tax=Candidatus Nitrobium versatile TaxID=2884831 RepID=A0A953JET6_9BACT|nr:hypothetical protein [Candidatus Nitrobium versatile]